MLKFVTKKRFNFLDLAVLAGMASLVSSNNVVPAVLLMLIGAPVVTLIEKYVEKEKENEKA